MVFVFSPDQDIKGAKFLEANNYMFFLLKIYNLFVTYYEIISILVALGLEPTLLWC